MAVTAIGTTNNADFNQFNDQKPTNENVAVPTQPLQQLESSPEKLGGLAFAGEAVKAKLNDSLDKGFVIAQADTGTKTAKAGNPEIDNLVNRLNAQPRQAGAKELIAGLQGKSADYQAELINKLVQKDPRRAANIFSQGANSDVLAKALSNAYNSQGSNGGAFLDNLIKNGLGSTMLNANELNHNVGSLVARSGNQKMIADYANKSLDYAHQLRSQKDNPVAEAVANALSDGAVKAASGNGTVLRNILDNKANDADKKALTNDTVKSAVATANRNRFGTDLTPQFDGLAKDTRTAGFAIRHPFIANDIGSVEKGSTNISTKAFRFSTQIGLNENNAKEGSQVNAYRHALWQATIAGTHGQQIAHEAGNAHEDNPTIDLTQRYFKNNAKGLTNADQTIDLLNNQIGRQIARDNPGASMTELARKTLDFFHNNGLYTAVEDKSNGSYHVEQTKISDEQYQKALKDLATLDENGRKITK
jgi:hypothetical protein